MNIIVGSGYIQDYVLNNRFGWTNPWISAGHTEALHFSSHSVGPTNQQHIALFVFAGHDSSLLSGTYGRYFINRHYGMLFATIGGAGAVGAGRRYNASLTSITGLPTAGMRLSADFNRPSDVNMSNKQNCHNLNTHCATTLAGLFTATNNFLGNFAPRVAYAFFPGDNSRYFNSSSFIHGLLIHAGIPRPDLSNATGSFPGWNSPLPVRAFR